MSLRLFIGGVEMNIDCREARNSLKHASRIVIKIGTSSLVHSNGRINFRRIGILARVIADLMNQDKEVVLVSSGAIGIGVSKLKLKERPKTIAEKQAVAAVGQSSLMQVYSQIFSEYGHAVAQILLTKDVIDRSCMKANAINTFEQLAKMKILPIVNENDTVAIDEIKFGDNDNLSYLVAKLIKADLLIILTDIDGYYNKNPHENPDAILYHNITDLSEKIEEAAGGAGEHGTGGMLTKVHACRLAAESGINAIIANGNNPEIIYRLLEGEDLGTLFVRKEVCDNECSGVC